MEQSNVKIDEPLVRKLISKKVQQDNKENEVVKR